MKKVGTYELGRTIGEGTFAKVKFARNSETGESVAMKVLAKSAILKHQMVDQIKREISIMKIVRHPSIVRLHEVLASRTKIYIILEFVTGGQLFDRIVDQGKLGESESRCYFQQLIDAVDYCHRKGVYHRDLKPENLLLDYQGMLKVSDFGLSALPQQGVGLLHTVCGTPNYVAPEVLSHQGYDGSAADIWSCGVILFVLMAGYLPFEETDLASLYRKDYVKRQTRFVSRKPAKVIVAAIQDVSNTMGLKVYSKNYKIRLEGVSSNNMGQFAVVIEVFEVAQSLFMVDVRKAAGDTLEYHKFYKNLCSNLEHIIWKQTEGAPKSKGT